MELRIFITGKTTGEETEACRLKFETAEKKLRQTGIRMVINPLKLGIPPRWKRQDITDEYCKVLRQQANSILLLNDWSDSFDARVLRDLALELKYEIFREDKIDEIVEYMTIHHCMTDFEIEFL
jgi:hypothetical protein